MTEHRDLPAVVPIARLRPGEMHDVDVKARCLVLYATGACRNAPAVAKLIERELADTGIPVPTRQTISGWIRDEN